MKNDSNFSRIEVMGSIGLFIATILGLALVNSPMRAFYENIINYSIRLPTPIGIFNKPLLFWINDGLICFFFLFLGLEIKRELLVGELSEKSKLPLPVSTALIGVVVPALIFTCFNYDQVINMRGWAIPTATDTAFCLGVLTLVGNRVPRSVRVFLISLAIIDDILAVAIIATFYTNKLSSVGLLATVSFFTFLVLLNVSRVHSKWPYILLGICLWIAMLNSGIHTSVVGVLLAAVIPHKSKHENKKGMLQEFETALHPWVAFLVIPLFAFANVGIPLSEFNIHNFMSPLSLGIIVGLFLGKQLGIFGTIILIIRTKEVSLPSGATWLQMYGAAVLCGIGFTMSIFIGNLAFAGIDPDYLNIVKSAIFIGSLMAALFGYLILRFAKPKY